MTANGEPVYIEKAINDYAARAGGGGAGPAPYNSESLAEIYHPRVRQLIDLQNEGHTHAVWKWDAEAGYNRWHGLSNLSPGQFGSP